MNVEIKSLRFNALNMNEILLPTENRQTTPCGGTYPPAFGQSQRLISQNYPNNFPVPHSCSWTFSVMFRTLVSFPDVAPDTLKFFHFLTFSCFLVSSGNDASMLVFSTPNEQQLQADRLHLWQENKSINILANGTNGTNGIGNHWKVKDERKSY